MVRKPVWLFLLGPPLMTLAGALWALFQPPCADFIDGPCSPGYDPVGPLRLFIIGAVFTVAEALVAILIAFDRRRRLRSPD